MRFGTAEIVILLVLALVIFGGSKLSGVGKALGTSIRDFKREMSDGDDKQNKTEITQTITEEKDEKING